MTAVLAFNLIETVLNVARGLVSERRAVLVADLCIRRVHCGRVLFRFLQGRSGEVGGLAAVPQQRLSA